jgi:hypothetical protein
MNSQVRSEQTRQLLHGGSPAVRRSALLTIAKLLGSDAGPDLEVALADESPAVCKEAARLITRLEDGPSAERLISIAGASGLRHVAIACCRVARHGNKWGWLKFILKVYGAPDSAVDQETFATEIDSWEARFNRSNAQPDADLLQEIASALRICEPKLSVNQLRLLTFTLRGNGAVL